MYSISTIYVTSATTPGRDLDNNLFYNLECNKMLCNVSDCSRYMRRSQRWQWMPRLRDVLLVRMCVAYAFVWLRGLLACVRASVRAWASACVGECVRGRVRAWASACVSGKGARVCGGVRGCALELSGCAVISYGGSDCASDPREHPNQLGVCKPRFRQNSPAHFHTTRGESTLIHQLAVRKPVIMWHCRPRSR